MATGKFTLTHVVCIPFLLESSALEPSPTIHMLQLLALYMGHRTRGPDFPHRDKVCQPNTHQTALLLRVQHLHHYFQTASMNLKCGGTSAGQWYCCRSFCRKWGAVGGERAGLTRHNGGKKKKKEQNTHTQAIKLWSPTEK